jgi:hypothetical protein
MGPGFLLGEGRFIRKKRTPRMDRKTVNSSITDK